MSINAGDRFWDILMQKIDSQKCILITGPDIGLDPNLSIQEQLKESVLSKAGGEVRYYPDDDFFSFDDPEEKEYALVSIQKFFDQLSPTDLHQKIVEIPFHLIISTSPDRLFKKAFEAKGFDFNFDFYNREQNPGQLEPPSKTKPLVYNLFGDIQSEGSLVYTYDDLFDYLIKIFGDFKLPQAIQNELKQASIVLFIGFRFDKWYFKLLLRLLKLNEVKIKGASEKEKSILPPVRNFYSEEFKMKFLDCEETEMIDFIFESYKANNGLRTKQSLVSKHLDEIFISYAWGGESEEMVDKLYSVLIEQGLNIIRDKINLGYSGNIKSFMETIGAGKYAIIVISDKYLKSDNCMYEMLELKKNGNVYNRIFPIVLRDAKIYNEAERMNYITYWEEQLSMLKDKFRQTDPEGNMQALLKINQYGEIRRIIDEITDMLRNMNTLTPEMLESSGFSDLLKALEKRIQEDNQKQI